MDLELDESSRRISLVFLIVVFVILFFFLIREFGCWFWKINALIKMVAENQVLLKQVCAAAKTTM